MTDRIKITAKHRPNNFLDVVWLAFSLMLHVIFFLLISYLIVDIILVFPTFFQWGAANDIINFLLKDDDSRISIGIIYFLIIIAFSLIRFRRVSSGELSIVDACLIFKYPDKSIKIPIEDISEINAVPSMDMLFLLNPLPFSELLSPPVSLNGWYQIKSNKYSYLFNTDNPSSLHPLSYLINNEIITQDLMEKKYNDFIQRDMDFTWEFAMFLPLIILFFINVSFALFTTALIVSSYFINKKLYIKRKLKKLKKISEEGIKTKNDEVENKDKVPNILLIERVIGPILIFILIACDYTKLQFKKGLIFCRIELMKLLKIITLCLLSPLQIILWSYKDKQRWFIFKPFIRFFATSIILTICIMPAATLLAAPIALLSISPEEYSFRNLMVSRFLLSRLDDKELPVVATKALEDSITRMDYLASKIILTAAVSNGGFILDWPDVNYMTCHKNIAEELSKENWFVSNNVKLILGSAVDKDIFLNGARCSAIKNNLPFIFYKEAYENYRLKTGQDVWPIDIFSAIDSYNPELIQLALNEGAKIELRDWQGRTPLLYALANLIKIQTNIYNFVDRYNNDFKLENTDLKNLLHKKEKLEEITLQLIELTPQMDVQDNAGRSLAYYLVEALRPEQLGKVEDVYGKVRINQTGQTSAGENLSFAAARNGFNSKYISPSHLSLVNKNGQTLLHVARDEYILSYLIERGLDPLRQDKRGRTALHIKFIEGDLSGARYLSNWTGVHQPVDIFGKRPIDYAPDIWQAYLAKIENTENDYGDIE